MRRISVLYIISLLIITCGLSAKAQDSIKVPLFIKVGFDIYGPANYLINKKNSDDNKNLSIEGYVAYDRDSKKTYVLEAGFQDFKYSQYNYSYLSKGAFIRGGVDFNVIKPFQAAGKYYAGVGLRYGLSLYNSEVPSFKHYNYWGTATGSVASSVHLAHFIEINPGIKTEIFKNVSIGWNIRLRLIIYRGTGKDFKPVSIPGFGNGAKSFSPGINYYIIFNFPYKSVFVKPEVEKPAEKETGTAGSAGTVKQ
jgi:hypothetical protein